MRKKEMENQIEELCDKVAELEKKIDIWLKGDIRAINQRIQRLECSHKNVQFIVQSFVPYYVCKCADCSKILVTYDSLSKMNLAEIEYLEKTVRQLKNEEKWISFFWDRQSECIAIIGSGLEPEIFNSYEEALNHMYSRDRQNPKVPKPVKITYQRGE